MTRWVAAFQNQLVRDDIALALVIEDNAAVFSKRVVSEVGVAVTLVAAPLALGLCWLSYHALFGALSYRPSRFLPCAPGRASAKERPLASRKVKHQNSASRTRTFTATSFSKGTAATLASWQLHPTFIRGKWESLIIRLHQRCIFGREGCFSTEISPVPH